MPAVAILASSPRFIQILAFFGSGNAACIGPSPSSGADGLLVGIVRILLGVYVEAVQLLQAFVGMFLAWQYRASRCMAPGSSWDR